MIKIEWAPDAASMVLNLVSADQRRVVDAIGDFRWRAEQDAAMLSDAVQQRVVLGDYEICYRVANTVLEILEVKLCRARP